MSTPASALKVDATSESKPAKDKPFYLKDFPADLRAAQLKLATLYARLRAHQAGLPWSREAHDGWSDETERGRERCGRPQTAGWGPEDAATYDQLWEQLRKATQDVQSHRHWKDCRDHGVQGADLVDVRQALKHATGAVPLDQGAVEKAA